MNQVRTMFPTALTLTLCASSALVALGCQSGSFGAADFEPADPKLDASNIEDTPSPYEDAGIADASIASTASEGTWPRSIDAGVDAAIPSLDVKGEADRWYADAAPAVFDAGPTAVETLDVTTEPRNPEVASDAAPSDQEGARAASAEAGETARASDAASHSDADGAACGSQCECLPHLMGRDCDQLKFVDITAGKLHTCGLVGDGSVRCWGNDAFGQVSNAPTGNDYVAIESGGVYSCALRQDHSVYCWGNTADISDVPLQAALSLATGWDAACIELSAGLYECWGNDDYGKWSDRPSEPVLALQIGWQQGCALLQDHSIECWGDDESGQATPPEGNDFVSISLASWHGCAQRESGTLQCWGTTTNAPPQPVKSMNSRGQSTCAILLDDSVRCWGDGGALEPPPGISAQKLAVGDGHSCALLTDQSITCWGQNADGAALPPSEP